MKRLALAIICCMLIGVNSSEAANASRGYFTTDDSNSDQGNQWRNGDDDGVIQQHLRITSYEGPITCIRCHRSEANHALQSVHMQWNGPTPDLINTDGEDLGKANRGINTFCTYAMSSGNTCFSCHVRLDGNAPHDPAVEDVDCLMCHSDVYRRKLLLDPNDTITVTTFKGEEVTYLLGLKDADGNYISEPDYSNMPTGITMEEVAQNVHKPTRYTCLRCHASAGGGDWVKRGDMGWSSVNPGIDEDVHLSIDGADLRCVSCHDNRQHKIGGRGIDLRQTEAEKPTCQKCHEEKPHDNDDYNRHATGQVSCQVCHIREFAKGGETEMSRDWLEPHWNPAFCYGQGGWVGLEIKEPEVLPEYVWFDGTSYVYNVGETIEPGENGIYNMAYANGAAFDGNSLIVPIKRHYSNIPLHDDSQQIIAPAIMWMFMTGIFDEAVKYGMDDQGLIGSYSIVLADAEMLITHGVDPSDRAPRCSECHNFSGDTPDGIKMLPFTELGYHEFPAAVEACTLCHERENMSWQKMHEEHRDDVSCSSCHISEPTGFITDLDTLCSKCHEMEEWEDDSHKEHIEEEVSCADCHTFE
ncbi:cytochrome c3 family protein [Desulfosediminicola flagellatus]|uniref:cytochrome c3 family protein n=1 Tax=Desulfosediminicola flagellatus TaxID=2569541 RepID=UPI0010ACB022|nr:cytochrome c3 family protein [Desulfosediminicola flagellatus]